MHTLSKHGNRERVIQSDRFKIKGFPGSDQEEKIELWTIEDDMRRNKSGRQCTCMLSDSVNFDGNSN